MRNVELRKRLAHNFILNTVADKRDKFNFGNDDTIDDSIDNDVNNANYNRILRIVMSSSINQHLQLADITKNVNLFLEQLIVLANGENEFVLEDYKCLVESLEFIVNENALYQQYVVKLLQQVKDFAQKLTLNQVALICKKYGVKLDAQFNNNMFIETLKAAIMDLNNNKVQEYRGAFKVNNAYMQVSVNNDFDCAQFKKELIDYLKNNELNFYVPNSKLISYFAKATDEEIKDFYGTIYYLREDYKESLKANIAYYKNKINNSSAPDIVVQIAKKRLKELQDKLKAISVDLKKNLWILQDVLTDDIVYKSVKNSILGRSYEDQELISTKIHKTRYSLIQELIKTKKIASQNESLIACPELRNNFVDDKKKLAFFKNFGMFLNYGVLCNYSMLSCLAEEYADRLDDYYQVCDENFDRDNRYFAKIGVTKDYDEAENIFINQPLVFNKDEINSFANKVEKEINSLTTPIRDLQREFAISQSDICRFCYEQKVVLKQLSTPNATYQILAGRSVNNDGDGYVYHLYVKELVKLYDEVSVVLYLLPDNTLNCPQQIERIDSLDYSAVDAKGNSRLTMIHKPTGVGKQEQDKYISSLNHTHVYSESNVLFRHMESNALVEQAKVGHYEIDSNVGDLLGISDMDDYFNKRYSVVSKFTEMSDVCDDINEVHQ